MQSNAPISNSPGVIPLFRPEAAFGRDIFDIPEAETAEGKQKPRNLQVRRRNPITNGCATRAKHDQDPENDGHPRYACHSVPYAHSGICPNTEGAILDYWAGTKSFWPICSPVQFTPGLASIICFCVTR